PAPRGVLPVDDRCGSHPAEPPIRAHPGWWGGTGGRHPHPRHRAARHLSGRIVVRSADVAGRASDPEALERRHPTCSSGRYRRPMSMEQETRVDVKPRSRDVTDGAQKAPSRAMLRAVGMGDDDWVKPQVGIASSWNEIT